MAYPSVLLFLDDDARAEVRNEQAVRFAQALGSHIGGLSCHRRVAGSVDLAAGMGGIAEPLTRELQAVNRAAVERGRVFLGLCDRHGVASFDIEIDESDMAARAILERAAVHDLVILGQPDPADADAGRRRAALDEVALNCPRPMLLLPYVGSFEGIGTRVLVAWDGSRGAARAVGDAMPLLQRAASVHVVQFDPRAESGLIDQAPLRGVVQWLERHGVNATSDVRYPGMDVGNALLSKAADVGADLMVMGCWGHGRLAERLMGGATRTVMASMTLPVLTSH